MKNNKKSLGLYIHIPFCVKKCNYCDFLSFPAEKKIYRDYAKLLAGEMALWQERLSGFQIDTIFIGGGTPSLLDENDMEVILKGLHNYFSLKNLQEFTIECNPGTVSPEKFSLYKQWGVNRISIGMQSAIDDELSLLGRIHTFDTFLKSYEQARKAGFHNINIDIMSAIPSQTRNSYQKTLQEVIFLNPEHISSYSLIVEEGTPFYTLYGDEPPVEEETDRLMYEDTGRFLKKAGYHRYEISNYAREGKECLHNLKYWKRENYLGLGLGASSFMDHSRFSNVRDYNAYRETIKEGEFPEGERERLSEQDEMAEFMFLGLRCMEGVSVADFSECFGTKIETVYEKAIGDSIKEGLLKRRGDRIFLTERGIDVSNRVFERFL
ncbi:MAG: oxygen-independent coproporphyrinogen III oxidase [Lachnospiraceae bacterium]|nr:oxygen-independent coproporphyrinogen III oxidase [Lachnospiraceae bacterium]